jgi:hypothetical protein
MATSPDDPSTSFLESMPLPSGPVGRRRLDDQYSLSTYPALFSGEVRDPPLPALTDSVTGRVTMVHLAQAAGATCDPVWCVMEASDASGAGIVRLSHPDGTGLARLGDADTSLVTTDPTLLDRFVALSEQASAPADLPDPTVQVWLYDIAQRRSIEVDAAATAVSGAGAWLWWSTGDSDTATWHALDVNTLR